MIEMEHVEKWYGEFKALSDVNLTVRQGEKIVLCGPSGSGKSTLIRCINHLETYSKGRILVDGIQLSHASKTIDKVRAEVGMVHVNNPTVGGEAQLPFGGWKSTGIGEREMAEEGAEFFTQLKTVFFDYTGQVRTSKLR